MKIGIDCRTILNPGYGENAGIGHYTYCLVEALLKFDRANRYVLFFDQNVSAQAIREFTHHGAHVTNRFLPWHRYRHVMPRVYEQVFLPIKLAAERLDLMFFPGGISPNRYRGKTVLSVHDLVEYTHPEWGRGASRYTFAVEQDDFLRSVKRAQRIIAVSETTKQELVEFSKIGSEKVEVIPEGVTSPKIIQLGALDATCTLAEEWCDADIRARFSLSPRYALFLGTIEPRKNVQGVIRAFAKYVRTHPNESRDLGLVIAGAKGIGHEEIFDELDATNDELEKILERRPIRYLGYVTTDEKWGLLRYASVFLFPSLHEGFGLPVLEAMSLGAPIVVSNRGALKELANGAGELIDPDFTESIYHGMAAVLGHPGHAAQLSEKAKTRAALYTWEKAAQMTLQAFHRALV